MKLPSQLQERLNQLPPELRQQVVANQWTPIVDRLATEFKLTPEQIEQLEIEILLVTIGLELRADFELNLRAALGLSEGMTKSIKDRVNEHIFAPLDSYLKTFEETEMVATAAMEAKYAKLPSDIQEAIKSVTTEESLRQVAEKYKLHIDQIGSLYDLVDQILIGELGVTNFTSELIRVSGVDGQTANNITRDINDSIFKPLQNSLRTISEKKGDFFEEKLSKMFTLPKDNSLIIKPYPPAEQPVGPQGQAVPGIDAPKPVIDDPYLEKI